MSQTTYSYVCEQCEKPFSLTSHTSTAVRSKRRFCSEECRLAWRSDHATSPLRICPQCGREHHKRTILCAACYRTAPRYELPEDAASLRYGISVSQSKICPTCGRTFFKKGSTSQAIWEQQTFYCSRACYGKAKAKPALTCESCGREYKPTGQVFGKSHYCSPACASASQRKPLPLCEMCGETCLRHGRRFCSPGCKQLWYRGPNVYNYLGGQGRDHYASADWLERAAFVRARDKVCQHCGAETSTNGKVLHAHHIVPWRISFDDSLDNLIALCDRCHKTEDHRLAAIYGG